MGRSISKPRFGEVFGFHHAMQLAVSTAFRSGSSICPETLAAMLTSEYPGSGMTEAEIRAAILKAAEAANVPIRQAAEAPPPVVYCPPRQPTP